MKWQYGWCAMVVAALLAVTSASAQSTKGGGKLKVYFVDVEGGQATLFVTPADQALLIDAGWPGNEARDAERIAAAVKDAGLKKIDYVLITHYPHLFEKSILLVVVTSSQSERGDPGNKIKIFKKVKNIKISAKRNT